MPPRGRLRGVRTSLSVGHHTVSLAADARLYLNLRETVTDKNLPPRTEDFASHPFEWGNVSSHDRIRVEHEVHQWKGLTKSSGIRGGSQSVVKPPEYSQA